MWALLEEPAPGAITKWERGKPSRLDPCHLLAQTHPRQFLYRGLSWLGWTPSTQISTDEKLMGFAISVGTEQPLAHSTIKTTVSFPPGALHPMERTEQLAHTLFPHSWHTLLGLCSVTELWAFLKVPLYKVWGLCFNKCCCLWLLVSFLREGLVQKDKN